MITLVDSSIYISILRSKKSPVLVLSSLAKETELAICGVVRCEVNRGLRDPNIRLKLSQFFDCMLYLPTPNTVWESAEKLLWQMDRTGIILPLADVVIAACAIANEATVLTFDTHFSKIPGLQIRNDFPKPNI